MSKVGEVGNINYKILKFPILRESKSISNQIINSHVSVNLCHVTTTKSQCHTTESIRLASVCERTGVG